MEATLVLTLSNLASNSSGYSLVQMPCETNFSRTELWLEESSQEKGLEKFADLVRPDSTHRKWLENEEQDFIAYNKRLSERFEGLSDFDSRNNQIFFRLITKRYQDKSQRELYGSGEILVDAKERFGNLESSFLVLTT